LGGSSVNASFSIKSVFYNDNNELICKMNGGLWFHRYDVFSPFIGSGEIDFWENNLILLPDAPLQYIYVSLLESWRASVYCSTDMEASTAVKLTRLLAIVETEPSTKTVKRYRNAWIGDIYSW